LTTDKSLLKKRVVVLISGGGSNLQSIIDAIPNEGAAAEVVAVISNRPGVFGLERAESCGIPAVTIDHKQFESRDDFDHQLTVEIDKFNPDLVVLAGFMRVLTVHFVERYIGRLINIHPSLLPKYPGLHTHKRALEAGDQEHGATVHFVTAELDGGPGIIQAKVPILAGDNETILAKRVLQQEHKIYPLAVQWICEGKIEFDQGQTLMDGKPLPQPGFNLND